MNKHKSLLSKNQSSKLTGILYLESKPVNKPICLIDNSTSEEIIDSFKNIICGEVKKHNNQCSFRIFIG